MSFRKIEGDSLAHLHNGWLTTGTVVRFGQHVNKLGGKVGVIEKFGRKKYAVMVDGQSWRVPPSIIEEIDPEADGIQLLQETQQHPTAIKDGSDNWLEDNIQVGDIVMFHRGAGSYDIAKVDRITPQGKPFCKVMNGRSRGKIYGFQKSWYVCKLPQERFRG